MFNSFLDSVAALIFRAVLVNRQHVSQNFCLLRGSVVVKELCYKPEGRGFETRWGELNFLIHLILPAARGPGLYSAGFDIRRYQIFWESVGLEMGPLSLVSTIEELLGRKRSGFGLEGRKYGLTDPSRWPRGTLYPHKLALTSPTSGGRSVGTVRPRTQTTE
jgi:hypothetical protein